jgi:hypothetical protein
MEKNLSYMQFLANRNVLYQGLQCNYSPTLVKDLRARINSTATQFPKVLQPLVLQQSQCMGLSQPMPEYANIVPLSHKNRAVQIRRSVELNDLYHVRTPMMWALDQAR